MEIPIVQLENVSVCYRMLQENVTSFKNFTIRFFRGQNNYSTFWALRDISLCVNRGDAIGIIGANGAGKSTLLRVIAGILCPTMGRVRVRGAVAPILGIGAGFDPELTGRENIYLYGAMLGYSRADINRKMDRLLDFADLGRFIDAPLRAYSDGMTARLAFAIATDTNPDLLLIDEVLAVGDTRFQQKCLDRMSAFNLAGTTIMLISHNLDTVARMCTRVIWVEHGGIRTIGMAADVLPDYKLEMAPSLLERAQADHGHEVQ